VKTKTVTRGRRALCAGLALLVGLWGGFRPAAVEAVETPLQAVPLELLLGTLGGAAGGVVGFWGTFAVCMSTGEDPTGWGSLICAILGLYGYGAGVLLGATVGVNVAGGWLGVRAVALSVVPFLSALGATLGYNLGATVVSPTTPAPSGPGGSGP